MTNMTSLLCAIAALSIFTASTPAVAAGCTGSGGTKYGFAYNSSGVCMYSQTVPGYPTSTAPWNAPGDNLSCQQACQTLCTPAQCTGLTDPRVLFDL
jgi:hypothetical protein